MDVLRLEKVSKFYKSAETVSVGMKDVSVNFKIGEFVAITGESGSGKSTLLNVISGLSQYEEGELFHYGEETSHYTINDWEKYRAAYIGFVFQNYNIIDSYTVYQNVLFALDIQGFPKEKRRKRALELIERVGLTSHKNHKASRLSGGQKQRCVLARALAKDTPIIVADEPTGNLDSESSKQVMALLHEISKDKLVIVVTHDYAQVENYATRKIRMHDGTIAEDLNIKSYEAKEEPVKVEVKKIPFLTMLKISLRNIFSTPKRTLFMLILQILVIGIFTMVFSSQAKGIRSSGLQSSRTYPSVPETRLLVERRDGKTFTNDEISKFSNHRNTLAVYENTHLFYGEFELMFDVLGGSTFNMISKTDSAVVLNKTDVEGKIPKAKNEVVISSDFADVEVGDVIGLRPFSFWDRDSEFYLDEFLVVGIDKLKRDTIYFSEAYLNQEDDGSLINESVYNYIKKSIVDNLEVMVREKYYKVEFTNRDDLLYDIQMVDTTITEEYIENYNEIATFISTTYDFHQMRVAKLNLTFGELENSNFQIVEVKPQLFEEVIETMMLNFEHLYKTDKKLLSIEVLNFKEGDKFMNSIDSSLYKVYYPANISSPLYIIMTFFLKFFSAIILFVLALFLYIIVFAVSRNVMASRTKDFAIFRSIGTNKGTLAKMVVIEQVIINIIGFVVTITAFLLLRNRFMFLRANLSYMKLTDYLLLFLIFMTSGIWLGLRFNKRIFNQSVIEVLTSSKGDL